jgi:alanine dehydrogenase
MRGIPLIVGIPRETKGGEGRIVLSPAAVACLVSDGHRVLFEAHAGEIAGHRDEAYADAGAAIASAGQAWDCELVVKVKEVQDADLPHLRRGATIFSFHHLPGEPERTRVLARHGMTALAFEMVRDANGGFPLLAPMSRIAGRMAIDAGLALAPGARGAARCLVLGAGHAGLAAAQRARELGLAVTVLTRGERSCDAAQALGFDAGIATPSRVAQCALEADIVVGAVFVPATPTPKLLPRGLVRRMKRGAVIVDISIDAGGVAETSRPTTHEHPSYEEEGVVHYAVPNIPAASPREGSAALSEAVLPYARALAGRGIAAALREDACLLGAVLLWRGQVCEPGIAAEARLPYTSLSPSDLA